MAAVIAQGPAIAAIAGATAGTAKLAFHHKKTAAVRMEKAKPYQDARRWQDVSATKK